MLDMMIRDIKNGIFGTIVGFVYSIEYQARGLPHAHILVFLAPYSKFKTSDDIDRVVCAEIPEDPTLQNLVIKFMCHNSCGIIHPTAPCMVEGKCCRHYPKPFSPETIWMDTMNQPVYKRRPVDNAHPWFETEISAHGHGNFSRNTKCISMSKCAIQQWHPSIFSNI